MLALVGASTCGTMPLPPASIYLGAGAPRLAGGDVGPKSGGERGGPSSVPLRFREKNEKIGLFLDLGERRSGCDPPKEVGASTHRVVPGGIFRSGPWNDLPESLVRGLGMLSYSSSMRSSTTKSFLEVLPTRSGSADRVTGRLFERGPSGKGGTGGVVSVCSSGLFPWCLVRLADRCLYREGMVGVVGVVSSETSGCCVCIFCGCLFDR